MSEASSIPVYKQLKPAILPRSNAASPDVVIVGAGPVGLTLALDLGRKGHQVAVLSQFDFIAGGSKAICLAKRSLDILDRLGVGQRMVEKGVVWNVGKVFYGEAQDPLYQFDMLPVKGQKNPGFINIQQYYVEEYLIDALAEFSNVDLRWGHKVIGLEQEEASACVTVRCAEGEYAISAPWVIAADGSKSPLRAMLGLDFEGRVFEDNFLIADVKFKEERPSERWFWFDPPFNGAGSALLHKQPDDVWRLDFQLGWDIDREAAILPENVEPYVRGMIGEEIAFEEEWYSVYTFQCRRMRHFVHDSVIFAGDAAHLVSPFGARGCNGGIADADNLAWKLDLVIRGEANQCLIDSYNYEAIVTADENILNSSRSTDFMTPKSKVSQAFRDAVLDLAKDHPFARPFVNSGRLSTPVSYPASMLVTPDCEQWDGGVAPGSPALDAAIGNGWLIDQLGEQFVLMTNGVGMQIDGLRALDVVDFENAEAVVERYGLARGSAYLIRPDQYVAARWRTPTSEDVQRALETAKGLCSATLD